MEQLDDDQQQQQQQEEAVVVVRPFDHQLARLRGDQCNAFNFRVSTVLPAVRWNMEQALTVSEALMASNRLGSLNMDLAVCRPDAVSLFLNYLGSSKSLKHLSIAYDRIFHGDSVELQKIYLSEFDNIFRAVLRNPSVETLASTSLGSNPSAIFELLSSTTISLKTFKIDTLDGDEGSDPTYESAFRTAAGFTRNASLKQVIISCTNEGGNLGVLISGLYRHPSLEDVCISYSYPDTELYQSISKLLHFTPTLEKLTIDEISTESSAYTAGVNFDWLLVDLYKPVLDQPACASLQVLHLIGVRIGMEWEKIYETESSSSGNVNNVVKELVLDMVVFVGRYAVKLLSQLTGLRTLKIIDISYEDSLDGDEFDEEWKNDRNCSQVWKELIERNPQLINLVTRDVNETCLDGLLEAACGHENLESLEHSTFPSAIQESRGVLLGQLLQKTKSLKQIQLKCIDLTADGIVQLAYGISHNQTLETVDLEASVMDPASAATLLGSMMVNKKLTYLNLGHFPGNGGTTTVPYHGSFGCTCLAVFRVNTTLLHLHLPQIIFHGTAMDELFGGLADSKSRLKTLSFSNCTIDSDNLVALGRGLERDDITLDKVHLPLIQGATSETPQDILCRKPQASKKKVQSDISELRGSRIACTFA